MGPREPSTSRATARLPAARCSASSWAAGRRTDDGVATSDTPPTRPSPQRAADLTARRYTAESVEVVGDERRRQDSNLRPGIRTTGPLDPVWPSERVR